MFLLEEYLSRRKELVDAELDKRLPSANTRPGVLHEAMRYSVFTGGKRLRPILCLAAHEAVGPSTGSGQAAMTAACAIEIFHTYTLIHDDLPAMDDDDLRRGQPTCHKKFGEANAILAGDALLTLAFEWLANYPVLVKELALAGGSQGVIAGQVEDLSGSDREYINLNKTAKLFQASVRMGALLRQGFGGQARGGVIEALSDYGEKIGLAFQLIDDVLDGEGDEGARERAKELMQAAIAALKNTSGDIEALKALARFAVERAY